LFCDSVKRITGAIHDIKRGNLVGAARHLGVNPGKRITRRRTTGAARSQAEAAAQAWLELQYGWKPLLSDLHGATVILHEMAKKETNRYVKATGRSTRTDVRTLPQTFSPPSGFTGRGGGVLEQQYDYTCKYVVYYILADPAVKSLSELGITNPLSVAWELMPWSFVIDWFLPIGNWLNSFDATNGLLFHSGCSTTYSSVKSKWQCTNYVSRPTEYYLSEGQQSYFGLDVSRNAITAFPTLPFPVFKNPASKAHLANALSLLLVGLRK